ncbi:MAG: hypothetical protein LLG00_13345 [Planctomycetaceae bacterium]|nr:hypothetical protein [Planctomycetaceae bacterium]
MTQYAYDSQGHLLSTTDGLSHATTYAYDNLSRLTSKTDALNGVTSYTYDANGNTLSVQDPDGNTTGYVYDSLDRVTSETNQFARARQYQYDDIGDVTQYTDRDFRVTKYQYDNLGRETGEQWMSGATVVHSFSYAYDALGQLLSALPPSDRHARCRQTASFSGPTPRSSASVRPRCCRSESPRSSCNEAALANFPEHS